MISLPNDPEAAADALIAAFARRSTRVKLVLPTRPPSELSEAELETQPCVVVQAGIPTYADLPITAAPRAIIEHFSVPEVAAVIANLDVFDVARLRSAEVPWLGGRLAFLPHHESEIEVPFVASDGGIALVGRTNEWIYTAMGRNPAPQLDETLLAYVRFFFSTVVGSDSAFHFAERVEDAIWLPDAPEEIKREFAEKLSPLRVIGTGKDGRQESRGTVIFKNALFVTSVMVAPNWEVELTDEDLLMKDLPIAFGQRIDLLVRR
jgi:hypothetical protein